MTLKAIVTFPDSIKIGTTGGRRLALNITQPATIKTAIIRLGKDGLSAYEIAKKYGFIGTEADFANYQNELAIATLNAAKSYADTQDTTTLSSAQYYADAKDALSLQTAKSYADTQDTATLNAANSYADAQDATTLGSAQYYADAKDALNLQTAKSYTDAQVSTAGAILQKKLIGNSSLIVRTNQIIPLDDTTPLITEGYLVSTLNFTPLLNTSVLRFRADLAVAVSTPATVIITLVFQDVITLESYCFAVSANYLSVANKIQQLYCENEVFMGSTNPLMISLRIGTDINATFTINGAASARRFGGALIVFLYGEEYK